MRRWCGCKTGVGSPLSGAHPRTTAELGYGIARRIEQLSEDEVLLNQGTIYAALVRLQSRGWIAAEWGASENNRRAKFYSITRSGRKRLAVETSYWQRLSAVIGRVLAPSEGGPK